MKKILCPTDFSEAAQNATVYAAKLAQATKADLTLLHVFSLYDFSLVSGTEPSAYMERLESLAKEVSTAFKISCYAEIEGGSKKLSATIHDKAIGYDLIVMGTNGPSDTYQLFGGSNTYNTITRSDIPLLLVPEDYQYTEIKRIVFAFDYLSMQNLKLMGISSFVKALNCEIVILQVLEESPSKMFEKELKDLQFIITQYNGDLNIHFETIRDSNAANGINAFVQRNQPDVLAVSFVHRNFIERIFHKSVIRKLSAIVNYPIYVFPMS